MDLSSMLQVFGGLTKIIKNVVAYYSFEIIFYLTIIGIIGFIVINIILLIKYRRTIPKVLKYNNDTINRIIRTIARNQKVIVETQPKSRFFFWKNLQVLKYFSAGIKSILLTSLCFITEVMILSILIASFQYMFFSQPYIVREVSYPQNNAKWTDPDRPIEIMFNIPVNTSAIQTRITPDVGGSWEFQKTSPFSPFARKLVFYPKESYPQGTAEEPSLIVAYIVDISPLGNIQHHEYSSEFFYNQLPTLKEILPADGFEDQEINTPIMATFDGDFTDLQITTQMIPAIEYSTIISGNTITVIPKAKLLQSMEYTLEIYATPYTRQFSTGNIGSFKESFLLAKTTFGTVKTPGIESSQPEGNAAHVDSQIKITFNTPMNISSVEEKFSISPEIEGILEMTDNKNLVFTPDSPLGYDTEYTIRIAQGCKNISGGVLEQDIVIVFRTIGKVKIVSTIPGNNAASVNANTKSFAITFDQEVDHASAQSKFSISPNVSGTFSWDGNTMYYTFASKLEYITTYTVTLAKGIQSVYGINSDEGFTFRFTTASNVTLIDVPWYKQTESFTCNVQATNMVLAFKGIYVGEQGVKNLMGIGEPFNKTAGTGGNPYEEWVNYYGVYWTRVSAVLTSQGVSNQIKTNWNVYDLAKEVEAGHPSILWWYNDWTSWGPNGENKWNTWTTPGGQTIWGMNGMHSEVVVGFSGSVDNPTGFYTNDPWRGKNRYYSVEKFKSLWATLYNPTAGIPSNIAIVIY